MRTFVLAFLFVLPAVCQSVPTSGLGLWLRSDRGVSTSGGFVDSWLDQSGNGHLFTAAGATRPEFRAGGTNAQPTIAFSGSMQVDGNLGVTLTEATIFTLARYTVASSNNDYLYAIGNAGSSGSQMCISRRNGDRPYHYDGRTQNVATVPYQPITQDVWHVHTQVFGLRGPTSHDWWIDGVQTQQTDAAGAYSVDASNLSIGNWSSGSYRFVGELIEILIYDRVLDAAERGAVDAYLSRRAGQPRLEFQDVGTWSVVQYEMMAQPDASWDLRDNDLGVEQTIDADPSIYLSDIDVRDTRIRGRLSAGSASDYMGFVFGYQDRGHYYLFDWKGATSSMGTFGQGDAGMRLRVIDVAGGGDPTGVDLWSASPSPNTTVLRANSVPWQSSAVYDFTLTFVPGSIDLEILQNGIVVESWSVADATYLDGAFGYYSNSCENASFGRLRVDGIEVGTPCGAGLVASAPITGNLFTISLFGASPNLLGALYISTPPAAPLMIPGGCTAEVDLNALLPLVPLTTDANGTWDLTLPVPPSSGLVGTTLAIQALLVPAPTSLGFELTNGVRLRVQ